MAELQNQVTLASWETQQLSDKNMALREKNLSQQASFWQPQPVAPTGQPQGQITPSQPTPEPVLFQEPNMDGTPKEMPIWDAFAGERRTPESEAKLQAMIKAQEFDKTPMQRKGQITPKVDTVPKPAIETPQDELNRIQQEVNVKGQINTLNVQEKVGLHIYKVQYLNQYLLL